MFSNRWKLLKTLFDGCMFMTPDRQISHPQFLQLFEAFLLQAKEMQGTVYLVPSEESVPLATYFADIFTNTLKIPAHGLIPTHKDIMLHLTLLLKKTDLLITLGTFGYSTNTLAATLTKTSDIPLITLTGGQEDACPISQGDLGAYFNTIDKNLIQTGQFSLFSSVVDAWPYSSQSSTFQQASFSARVKPQAMLAELRL